MRFIISNLKIIEFCSYFGSKIHVEQESLGKHGQEK